MKFKTPIVTMFEGRYVAPGTEIELDDDEARAFIARHGVADADQTLSADDLSSINELNKQNAILNRS